MSRVFVAVSVVLTESEYRAFRKDAPLMMGGTVAEVLRDAAGLPSRPYGYTRAPAVVTELEFMEWS